MLLGSQIRVGSRAFGVILTAVLSLADAAQLGRVWAATPQQIEQAQELINQANRLLEQGGINEATKLWERAVKIVEEQLGNDHPDVASGLDALAGLYQHQGQYGVAESLFKRALQARENGLDHPDRATSLNNLALLYDKRVATARPNCSINLLR